jgi:hypothetical protein
MAQAVSRKPLTAEAGSIRMWFVVDSDTVTGFSPELGYPSQYHFALASILVITCGWTICPLVAAVQRRSSLLRHEQQPHCRKLVYLPPTGCWKVLAWRRAVGDVGVGITVSGAPHSWAPVRLCMRGSGDHSEWRSPQLSTCLVTYARAVGITVSGAPHSLAPVRLRMRGLWGSQWVALPTAQHLWGYVCAGCGDHSEWRSPQLSTLPLCRLG